jgi:biopolymer transport protein ExbB
MFLSILLQLTADSSSLAAAETAANKLPEGTWELALKGGIVMIPIGIMLVIALYITIERWLTISKSGKLDVNFMSSIKDMVLNDNIIGAKTLCGRTDTPIARMLEKGISRIGNPLKNIEVAVENVGKLEVYKLEKGMPWLATIAGAAPMLGFLGTVTGMISTFGSIARAGDQLNASALSGGIYEAMVTTVAGLVVGIFAFLAYNLLTAGIEKVVYKMEATSDNPDMQMAVSMMQGSTLDVYFKEKQTRAEMKMGAMMNMTTISNENNGEMLMLMSGMVGQNAIKSNLKELDSAQAEKPKTEVTLENETKVIEGYTCKKAIVTDEEGTESVFWYTEEISVAKKGQNYLNESVPGFPMQSEINNNGLKMIMTVTKVDKKLDKKASELFDMTIPSGYKEMTMEQLKSMGM